MKRTIEITLEQAKKLYKVKKSKDFDYTSIKTFEDALLCICKIDSSEYNFIAETLNRLEIISKASAAMFKLNIIRKVLNSGYNMRLTKNAENQNYTWYPYFRFVPEVTEDYIYCDPELKNGIFKMIGKITSEGVTYDVFGSYITERDAAGLGYFISGVTNMGFAKAGVGFLGCATKEIVSHFREYFGILIMEAMYGDIEDFKIVK